MFRNIFFLTLTFSICFISIAQKPGLTFHNISVNDGLSENTVRDIIEDKKGFMWFGTDEGLNKYDGYKFTTYKEISNDIFSISSSAFKSFFIDSKKNMWILTNNGVNIYDPVLNIFYNFKNNKYSSLKNLTGIYEGITEDKNGNIWITSDGNGLYKIENLNTNSKKYLPLSMDKLLSSILIDTDSTLWVGTKNGLLKFNINTCLFSDLSFQYGQGYDVRSLFKDQEGTLWICTTNGLKAISKDGMLKEYYYSPSNLYSLNYNNVSKIIPHKNGNFLVALDGGGIEYFDKKNEKFYHYTDENESQLTSNNIITIYEDSKGDIWAGTYLNGINYSNETTNLFVLIKNNPYSDKTIKKGIIKRFLKDSNGNFWVATDGGGLYKQSKGSGYFFQYKAGECGLTSNKVISIIEDKEKIIWITTYEGGLCKYNPQNNTFKNYTPNPSKTNFISNDKVRNMCIYNNKIWITTYGTGISVLNPKTERFTNYRHDKFYPQSIPSDWAVDLLVDKNNTLWIGTLMGLCKFNPAKNNFENFFFQSKDASININSISEMIEDRNGNIWIGTNGGGLILFNSKDKSYKIFTTREGLSNNTIKAIIEDNYSNLWLSTNNGITQLNTITKKTKAYTIQDGVPPCSFSEHAKFKDESGRIYFGTNNGYLVIDPTTTGENKLAPPVVITELKIFNQTINSRAKDSPLKTNINEANEIILSYDQNSLTFEFASLNFNSSQNNEYAYWLEGFEHSWVMAGRQRTATYTNLNPGQYIFKVKASNNDNVWNEKGALIKVTIKPPFWATWWFNTLIISLLFLLLYLIYRWRTNRSRNKYLLLEETVKQRTSELKEANEQLETFVYKASHDIKGPLRSIIGLTTIGQKDVKDETALNYFDHILKSTKKLDMLLRDLLEVTKVKQATIQKKHIHFNDLVTEGISRFENLPGFEKIKFNVNIEESIPFYSDKKLIFSLIQNLIENPIKYADFTKTNPVVNINILTYEKGVEIIIEDNGIGIPEEYQKKVFDMFFKVNESSNGTGLGLYIVKTTVEKLNGTVKIESVSGIGSKFIIKL